MHNATIYRSLNVTNYSDEASNGFVGSPDRSSSLLDMFDNFFSIPGQFTSPKMMKNATEIRDFQSLILKTYYE